MSKWPYSTPSLSLSYSVRQWPGHLFHMWSLRTTSTGWDSYGHIVEYSLLYTRRGCHDLRKCKFIFTQGSARVWLLIMICVTTWWLTYHLTARFQRSCKQVNHAVTKSASSEYAVNHMLLPNKWESRHMTIMHIVIALCSIESTWWAAVRRWCDGHKN